MYIFKYHKLPYTEWCDISLQKNLIFYFWLGQNESNYFVKQVV